MAHFNLEELKNADQLIKSGKIEEALNVLRNFKEKGEHTLQDNVTCHLLKCELLFQQGLFEDLLKLAEQTYKESLGLGPNLLSVNALMWKVRALTYLFRLSKVFDVIKQGEELLKTLTHELPADYKQTEATIAFAKGLFLYWEKRDADLALEQLEHSLALREKIGSKFEITLTIMQIAKVLSYGKGELNRALKFVERGLVIAKEINSKFNIAWGLHIQAVIYYLKGDLDRSVLLYEQSLPIFKELNNKFMMANVLNNMGDLYRRIGELDSALERLEQSLALRHKSGNLRNIAIVHDSLIQIFIEKGDLERAQQFLHDMEQLITDLKDKQINRWYLFDKALLLKKSLRARNRVKAENILMQIVKDEDSDYELTVNALLNLCELFLVELRMTNDLEVLEEVESLIVRLLDVAKNSSSYFILCETYILQARLALITLDLKKARSFLTQGQQVAENYGLKMLAIKISNEHDELLKQLTIWENLEKSEAALTERLKLARLNEHIDNMLRKRVTEPDEIQDEVSVVILIISKGGTPIFSQSFEEGWLFQDDLFGGFLSAVNSFSDEMFSQGLDRAIFGEYTIIMNALSPFIVCYLFKGQSFLAQQRMKHFVDTIQTDKKIWEPITKYYQANRLVQEKDIPSLDLLVNEIFIERAILH